MILDQSIQDKMAVGDPLTVSELKKARAFYNELHESLLSLGKEYRLVERRVYELKMRLDDIAYSRQTQAYKTVKFNQIPTPPPSTLPNLVDFHGREL